jgi:Cu-Zn family superoxide dismutase
MRWIPAVLPAFLSVLPVAGAAQEPVRDSAREPATATADLRDGDGRPVGTATLVETPRSGVLLRVAVHDLPPGTHAFHIHETGSCEAPDFTSAGGHYDPHGHAHGVLHGEGAHAGDLLNVVITESGASEFERLAVGVTLHPDGAGSLLDADGSAIVIHAGADDYESQPSGAAGSRIVCGVVVGR